MVFNATFNNISVISWGPVLVVEEIGVPGEDHGQATGKLYHLRLRVECTLYCNLQSRKVALKHQKSKSNLTELSPFD
jgi:hypothetical protein